MKHTQNLYQNTLLTLFVLIFSLLMLGLPKTVIAQTDCRWDGTAPACNGECNAGESEITRLGFLPGGYPPYYYGPDFGKPCVTGSKALCCKTPGVSCRWDGTAPFCDGECLSNETASQPPAGSSSGKPCWTGSKVYCCKAESTGSSSSGLTQNPEVALYAAIWEKGSGPEWQARHDLTSAQYQQEFNTLKQKGFRLVDVSGFSLGGQEHYAAIWEKREGPAWQARHGLTSNQYQQEFNALTKKGYRLIHISGYSVGTQDLYAAIWEKREGPAWKARHNLTSAQYQQEFDTMTQKGYRLVDISGYNVSGQDRYAAIWEKREGSAWQARHGLTSTQYQKEFDTLAKQGYQLVHISGWRSGNSAHYAAIWEKGAASTWKARHGMSSDAYQTEFDKLLKEGYRLKDISGYKRKAS